MRRCSSDNCSGVKTDSAAVSSINHDPPRTVVSVVITHLHAFENSSGAHAPTYAHGHGAGPSLPAAERLEKRRGQVGPGAGEGVAKRNGPDGDVQTLGIDWQLAKAGNLL